MTHRFGRSAALLLIAAIVSTGPAWAHHPMGGATPSTFVEGVLSGFGHPIIGIDHLAFLVAVGVAVGIGRLSLLLPAVFVAMSAIGVALHAQGIGLPAVEIIVAASVILIGVLVARGTELSAAAWAGLFAVAGLFHGHAYGEAIFGAEATPLVAYFLGLIIIQTMIATGIAFAVRKSAEARVTGMAPRLAGAVVAGIGIAALAGQVLPG